MQQHSGHTTTLPLIGQVLLWPQAADAGTSLSSRDAESQSALKRAAVARLYESHFDRVARYIAVRIGDFPTAEDLASEVFVRAVRSVDAFQDTGAPMEAWLFKIAHNIVVDHLRKLGRRPQSVPIEEAAPLPSKHNPGADIERQQEIEELQRAMAQLSEAQRQVLSLRFAAEMSSEEAARVMGKNAGAVRQLQSAAVKKLREILGRVGE